MLFSPCFFWLKNWSFSTNISRVYCILKRPETEPLVFEDIANHSDDFTEKRHNQRHLKSILTQILCGI